jgi:hypothetical protein
MTPYDRLFPFLFPEIHQDKANKVQALFDKYKVCYLQAVFTIISFFLSSALNIFSLWCKALPYY